MTDTIPKKERKKVLFVIYSLAGGGAERVLVHLLNHIDRSRFDCLLAVFRESSEGYAGDLRPPVRIIPLGLRSVLSFPFLVLRLAKIIRKEKIETLVGVMYAANIAAMLASFFCSQSPRRILCEHSFPPIYLKKTRMGFLKKIFIKLTYPRADKIVAISDVIKDALLGLFPVSEEKIIVINNPVSLSEIEHMAREKEDHRFFADPSLQVVVALGRLIRIKGFDRLIRAFRKVKEKKKNARLLIMGEGEMRSELETLIGELGLADAADLAGFRKNPFACLSRSALFVSSSDYEGFPMSVLEALACGLPVVATKTPSGASQIIREGVEGFLVPLNDEEAMAGALLRLLEDPSLRLRMSEAGKKRTQDFCAEKIVPLYESLL